MNRTLRIAHVASEVEPFSRSGGLANVLGSLPKAHSELGLDVLIITPLYEHIVDVSQFNLEHIGEEYLEMTKDVWEEVSYYKGMQAGITPVYFIASKKLFGPRVKLYGAENDNARFMFFDVAALHLLKKINFQPDIIQCHDWHSGLIPYFLKGRYKRDPFWEKTATLYTIHNLAYQFGHNWFDMPPELRDDGRSKLPPFGSPELERINFAKRAIIASDAINTVSETYRKEIMTASFGEELDRILRNREKIVFGIVNGIDYNEYNPLTDPGVVKHYSDKSANLKSQNKKWLQKYYKLQPGPDIPVLCMTSRIAEQKGFRLFQKIAKTLLNAGVEIIVMGDGDARIKQKLESLEKEYPKQFVIVPFDHDRETMMYAGSDIFLLPSRFEPCGINQMIAMRYGCIPVVHYIGGLADTVEDYDPRARKGNGFVFKRYSAVSLLIATIRATETYKHKRAWKDLMVSSMRRASSWLIPALKYIDLYETTLRLKKRGERKRRKALEKV